MGLSLKQSDIAILEHKTEGWIVGLQLAGLSMRDGANPSSFIAGLKGSHRIILSYLTEQVLGRQPQDFRQFLLETSILEALNGDLCDALTLRSDGSVMLEQLFDGNLFLIPLDDERRWYRYHHLFADLLYDLLVTSQKDRLEELHQRASRWYSRAGMVNEAIEHALAARDFAMAVKLLETHAMEMIAQGYVKTMNTWVEALPQEWKFRSPKTNLAFAWALLLHGAYSQASPYLERLERGFKSIKEEDGEGRSSKAEWYVINALLSNMEGKLTEGLSLADEAIRIVPESDNRVLSLAYFGRAGAFQALDNYAEAEIAYKKAIKYGRASGNLIAEMMGASGLAQLAFEQGRLHLAYEICTPMISRGNELSSPFPISTVVFGSLGMIYFQWYQTKQAREYLNKALQLSILGGLSSGVINCHILLSRLSQIEGDWEATNRETELALDLLRADTPSLYHPRGNCSTSCGVPGAKPTGGCENSASEAGFFLQ
jgi:LuxR family maltose regulon positive regulatory protein